MNPEFWIKAWNEGRTNFHQKDYHGKLMEYFPQFNPQKGQSVLVPLCGKSKDLLWLQTCGLNVHGIELHAQAVEDFFSENKLQPVKKIQDQDFIQYTCGNILISCGDFFKLSRTNVYDFIYDRGALVALPASMRKDYAQVIKRSLKKDGKYLLIAYEYDQSKMEGPPFSISEQEMRRLYADQFIVQCVEHGQPENEGARLAAVESLRQKVYILEKIN